MNREVPHQVYEAKRVVSDIASPNVMVQTGEQSEIDTCRSMGVVIYRPTQVKTVANPPIHFQLPQKR